MHLPEVHIRLRPPQILVLGFAAVILCGALLLTLPSASNDGRSLRFLDALFTATSAVCVTGLVVVDTATQYTRFGQIVILCLIQVGGLGFMTMSTMIALLIGKRISLQERLVMQEAFNQFSPAGLVRLARNVLLTTLVVEGTGAAILAARFAFDYQLGQSLYMGAFHAVSAFCNAGFDVMGRLTGKFSNLTAYVADPFVSLTIGGLIVVGGIGFPVIQELYHYRRTRRLSLHSKLVLKITAVLIGAGTILILLFELSNPETMRPLGWGGRILAAIFQSITPRTAGFNTLNIGAMTAGSIFLLTMLMFIGASPSSTGGGIKTTTFGVILATIISTIRGYDEVDLAQRRLPRDLIFKALTITALAAALVITVTLIMTFTEAKATFAQILFEVVSAFGTVGLSTGITPSLSDLARVLIIMTMFIGRLGPLTVAVALGHRTRPGGVVYIEDRVMIG
ncbi:MAG: TrkH family potassium uptake protein [Bacteroidota bacterium]